MNWKTIIVLLCIGIALYYLANTDTIPLFSFSVPTSSGSSSGSSPAISSGSSLPPSAATQYLMNNNLIGPSQSNINSSLFPGLNPDDGD